MIILHNSCFNIEKYQQINIYNYKENTFYESSRSIENATLYFDFKSNKIQITDYALKSSTSDNHLKNWVVEVSNDKEKWKIIDTHTNDPTLNNQSVKAVFSVNGNDDTFYRYVQIRQTGVSWYNNGYLHISRIEFFGKLME